MSGVVTFETSLQAEEVFVAAMADYTADCFELFDMEGKGEIPHRLLLFSMCGQCVGTHGL